MSLFLYLFFIPNKRSVGITHTKYYRTIIWKNNVSFFSNLDCNSLSFGGVQNFKIVDANDTGFNIQFTYGGRTYKFFPSDASVTVS